MYISQETAQTIVEEIGQEIDEHINFIDNRGYIIASTDEARIGDLHEGAKRIIKENLEELYITAEMENASTKKGLNLPIRINHEIVGVIGITGEREQVMRYGNIVRRMTEIMLEDSMTKDERRYDRRVRYRFLEEWIETPQRVNNQNFVERGKRLGIDITRPRRAMMVEVERYHELSLSLEGQRRLENIESSVRHLISTLPEALYLREPERQICLIAACPDEKMRELSDKLAAMVQQKYGEAMLFGIDGETEGSEDVGKICREAKRALDCCKYPDEKRLFYHDLNVEILLNDITEETMEEYLHKLFPSVSREEMKNDMELIEGYFRYEGSVTRAAEQMFIHKNTFQYRLKKLKEETGKDIRQPSEAAVYMMALYCYRKLNGEHLSFRMGQNGPA